MKKLFYIFICFAFTSCNHSLPEEKSTVPPKEYVNKINDTITETEKYTELGKINETFYRDKIAYRKIMYKADTSIKSVEILFKAGVKRSKFTEYWGARPKEIIQYKGNDSVVSINNVTFYRIK